MRKLLAFLFLVAVGIPTAQGQICINELRISSPGGDDSLSNYFELAGASNASFAGLTMLSISSEFNPGEISFAIDLDGLSMGSDGFFLAGADATFWPGTDLVTGIDYFGSPQSFVLVDGFTGSQADDLDADDDGVLDATPWASIVDAVSLIDDDANTDFSYGFGPVLGPDGTFPPAHIFLSDADCGSVWSTGEFGDLTIDTPGFSNIAVPEPTSGAAAFVVLTGLMLRRRKA